MSFPVFAIRIHQTSHEEMLILLDRTEKHTDYVDAGLEHQAHRRCAAAVAIAAATARYKGYTKIRF